MLNKKSFDINNEEKKTVKSERLYQPKRFRWCKFIVIPLLAGFILLLILTNVDFSGDAYNQTWLEEAQTMIVEIDAKINKDLKEIQSRDNLDCKTSSDSCSVTCTGGSTDDMHKQLEPLYEICGKDMEVILKDCEFPTGNLKADFFEGNFLLKELNIINSNLNAIDEGAFKHDSVKYLKNLYLINTQFLTLEKSAFDGLEQLENLQFINQQTFGNNFKGKGFLDKISKTLTNLLITQLTTDDTIYNPEDWLTGANMMTLRVVNFANNNFQNILSDKTFKSLVTIEELILTNCNLNYFPSNIFDNNLATLKRVDLSDNHLTLLSSDLLMKMNGFTLNLNDNYWDCICDNQEMLAIIQSKDFNITYEEKENLKCDTPTEKYGVAMEDISLEECLANTTPPNIQTTDDMETSFETSKFTPTDSSSETDESNTTSENNNTGTTEMETNETSEETSESSKGSTITTTEYPGITTTEEETDYPVYTSPTEPETTITPGTTETTHPQTTITPTPPIYSSSTSTTTTSTTTTTTTTTTTPPPTTPPGPQLFTCYKSDGVSYLKYIQSHKYKFSIYSTSITSVEIVFPDIISGFMVLYFTNFSTSYHQQHILNKSIQIQNLDPNLDYVFCLIESIFANVSPFDCKGYARQEVMPQPWILKDDLTWIVCIVVLGTCLMLFLGIIMVISIKRMKKRRNLDTQTSVNNEAVNGIPLRNLRDSQTSRNTLCRSQNLPPDVMGLHSDCGVKNYVYEDLTM